MTRNFSLFAAVAALLVFTATVPARADVVTASGAGPLPGSAEDLTGVNVSEIDGSIPNDGDALDVNVFKINITNYVDFSAISVGSAFDIPDTIMVLFDSSGDGVYANDDNSGSNTLACLPSADGSNPCSSSRPAGVGPASDGIYYLAIAYSQDLPLSAAGEIFTIFNSTDVVGPDLTMGGGSPITGWDGDVFTSPDFDDTNYTILLTGVSATTPEPATWTLLAPAVGLLFAGVKFKATRQLFAASGN
jgi:hypothetical protein